MAFQDTVPGGAGAGTNRARDHAVAFLHAVCGFVCLSSLSTPTSVAQRPALLA
jgi:hypothetical protein